MSVDASLVKQPGVAGMFYPADRAACAAQVNACLNAALPASVEAKVLVVPHAGYVYSGAVAATAYATLALIKHGDAFNASRAVKWLVSQRNAYGGFGSTQDTVMALQALIEYSSGTRADVDLTVTINSNEMVNAYMNVFELPSNGGAFVFGSPWGIGDLSASYNGATEVTMVPNSIGDPDPFWYVGGGAPGNPGNKSIKKVTFTQHKGINCHTGFCAVLDFS